MADPNYIRAESKSFAMLKRFGITQKNFDIEDVAFGLHIEIKDGGISCGDAWLVRHEDGTGTIRLNSANASPRRRRFSIAHELGHWEQHPDLGQGYLCTGRNLRDYGQSAEEAEANWFAATLLMPGFLIPPEVHMQDPDFAFIRELASNFQTSFTAAARRMVSLSRQPLLLVASTGGRVLWTARSKPGGFLFVASRGMVPQYSLTAEVLRGESSKTERELAGIATWFPDLHADDDAELFEQVSYSSELDMALTLLWMPR